MPGLPAGDRPHTVMDRPANLLRRSSAQTDIAVGELNASDARKYGYREQGRHLPRRSANRTFEPDLLNRMDRGDWRSSKAFRFPRPERAFG
ncbi:hypothetical protein CBM2626_A140018 [Cupriavidus taiwanensis]|nr:hypothetical protein CBM2626_A140018 [Cupriavidus taiwanensis]